MLNDLTIALILTQREQQRLKTQAKRLSRYDMDDVQLTALRQRWQSGLGYRQYASALLASLDHLIEQLQQGEYHPEDYDAVLEQLSTYRHSCWALLRQTFGSPSRYLDSWGKVKPQFRYAFEQTYEANAKLLVESQATWLRELLPASTDTQTKPKKMSETASLLRQLTSPPDVAPEDDTLTDDDDTATSRSNVVDLHAYRQRRRNK